MSISNQSRVPKVSSNAFKNLPPTYSSADERSSGSALASSPQPPLTSVTNADKRQRSNSSPPPVEMEPPSKKAKGDIPVFRQGAEVDPKNPKASDYEDVAHALILRAASEYECFISTDDAFPDTAKRNKWAKKTWKSACAAANEHYEISDAISKLAGVSSLGGYLI